MLIIFFLPAFIPTLPIKVKLFPGDEIVAVNGIAVTTFDYREACSYFQGLKQDTEIQLSISNTGERGKGLVGKRERSGKDLSIAFQTCVTGS